MRYACFLLTLACGGLRAEWVPIGESGELTLYVDPATVVRVDSAAKMSALYDHKSPRATLRGWLYRSEKVQAEFDCHRDRWRALYSTFHFGNMGSGPMFGEARSWDWVSVAPESVADKALRVACGPR